MLTLTVVAAVGAVFALVVGIAAIFNAKRLNEAKHSGHVAHDA
ncbi:MAG: hypothetical protein ACYC5H_12200 [Methylovirgula sp.]